MDIGKLIGFEQVLATGNLEVLSKESVGCGRIEEGGREFSPVANIKISWKQSSVPCSGEKG